MRTEGDEERLGRYNAAVKRWASQKTGIPAEKISDVRFEGDATGDCETCGTDFYTKVTVTYDKWRWTEITDFPTQLGDLLAEIMPFAKGED